MNLNVIINCRPIQIIALSTFVFLSSWRFSWAV